MATSSPMSLASPVVLSPAESSASMHEFARKLEEHVWILYKLQERFGHQLLQEVHADGEEAADGGEALAGEEQSARKLLTTNASGSAFLDSTATMSTKISSIVSLSTTSVHSEILRQLLPFSGASSPKQFNCAAASMAFTGSSLLAVLLWGMAMRCGRDVK